MIILGILMGIIIGGSMMCVVQINRVNMQEDYRCDIITLRNYLAVRIEQAKRDKEEQENVKGMQEALKIYETYFEEDL